jgi:hypothetical protein
MLNQEENNMEEKYYIVYSFNDWDVQLIDTLHFEDEFVAQCVWMFMRKEFPKKQWYYGTSLELSKHVEEREKELNKDICGDSHIV